MSALVRVGQEASLNVSGPIETRVKSERELVKRA